MKTSQLIIITDDTSSVPVDLSIASHHQLEYTPFSLYETIGELAVTQQSILVLVCLKGIINFGQIKILKEEYPQLPILLICEDCSGEDMIKAIRHGADDILTLPSNVADLNSRVNALLESQQRKQLESSNLQNSFKTFTRLLIKRIKSFWTNKRQTALTVKGNQHSIAPTYITATIKEEDLYPVFNISLFGEFKMVYKTKTSIEIKGKKTKSLLAFLLLNSSKAQHRDVLMEMFWPMSHPDSARNCLNVVIHNIKKQIRAFGVEEEFIIYKDGAYQINPMLKLKIDRDEFIYHWKQGRIAHRNKGLFSAHTDYEKAVSLYKGELLEDMIYEEWAERERENLKESYLAISGFLSTNYYEQGLHLKAIETCQRMLQKDNCLEEIHRLMILCYSELGMKEKAVRQYYKCKKTLAHELEISPSFQTQSLYKRITGKAV